jgi:hypothetical protein
VFLGTPKTTLPLPCGAPCGELHGKGRKTFVTRFFFQDLVNKPFKPMKKQGRPPMLTGKRTHIIKAKLTDDEFKALLEIQKISGLNRMELIRRRVLGKMASTTINISELLNALNPIGSELGKAGNNINQLARHANVLNKQHRLTPELVNLFSKLFTDYIRIQHELEKRLRQLLRTMK